MLGALSLEKPALWLGSSVQVRKSYIVIPPLYIYINVFNVGIILQLKKKKKHCVFEI